MGAQQSVVGIDGARGRSDGRAGNRPVTTQAKPPCETACATDAGLYLIVLK